MNDDFENQLRAALRPVAPARDLSARVIAQWGDSQARDSQPRTAPRRRRGAPVWWTSAGLAAALLLGVGLQHRAAQQREIDSGLRARRQVIEALQVTNQKLDLALRVVSEEASS